MNNLLTKMVMDWNNVARDMPPTVQEQEKITHSEVLETLKAISEEDLVEELDGYADVYFTKVYLESLDPESETLLVANRLLKEGIIERGGDIITDTIKEVIRSNWTKFVEVDTLEDTDEYIAGQLNFFREMGMGDILPVIRIVESHPRGVIVFLNEDNKVMKPASYEAPDIMKIINNHLGEEL
jgi:hypothetical protein